MISPSGEANQPPGSEVDLGNITLGDLLGGLLVRADYPWEDLPLDEIDLPNIANEPGTLLHYNVSLEITGTGAAQNGVFAVTLPDGFRYVRGTSSIGVTNTGLSLSLSRVLPDPVVVPTADGRQLTWRLFSDTPEPRSNFNFVAGDSIDLNFQARPGLTLGSFTSDVTVSTDGPSASALDQDPVQVLENFEPNSTPGTAVTMDEDTLYISHIATPGDLDFFELPVPDVAGSRVSVLLSHQALDGDLAMSRPTIQELRPTTENAAAIQPVDDAPADVIEGQAPPPETLQDTPLSSIPLSSISANRGTADETVASISLTTEGAYTLQVSGYNGSSGPEPYVLRAKVTSPPPAPTCVPRSFAFPGQGAVGPQPGPIDPGTNTLILVNQKRLGDAYGPAQASAVMGALANPALHGGNVKSAVIPVDSDPDVATAYGMWDTNPCSPDAANKVVEAINSLVDGYRNSLPDLAYIVLVGSDEMIPMARIPDITRVSNERDYAADARQLAPNGPNNALFASFITSNILSDDPYGDFDPIPYLNRQLYVPDVALGRLVESPTQIVAQIAQFEARNGTLDPQTALTTGYDFLSDSALDIADALDVAISGQSDELIDFNNDLIAPWTRDDLINRYSGLPNPPDIASINAHFNHFETLPAAGNFLPASRNDLFTTQDLLTPLPADLTGTIVFSMGCHSGLNVGDTIGGPNSRLLDWPDASFGRGAAVYVGNTGYGYGDTDISAYSEELMTLFAERLDGSLSIGKALQFAKQAYKGADRVQFETYDEKVMVQTVFYGLPMYGVGTPPPPVDPPTPLPIGTDDATGFLSVDVTTLPDLQLVDAGDRGKYYEANGKAASTSGRPIEPVMGVNLPPGPNGAVAHGIVLTDATTVDEPNFDGVFTKPAIDASTAEVPVDAIFPTSISNLTTFDTPDGPQQRAVFMPGQYIPDPTPGGTPDPSPDGIGTHRSFTSFQWQALYSTSEDFTPPTIRMATAELNAGTSEIVVDVIDDLPDNVVAVSILYHELGNPEWTSINLAHTGPTTWTGSVSAASVIEFFAYAIDGGANVGQTTDKGEAHDGLPATVGCTDGDCDGFQDVPPTALVHAGPANSNPGFDNCGIYNPTQLNADGNFTDMTPPRTRDDLTWINSDSLGDDCDVDDDNDGLDDAFEAAGVLPCLTASEPTSRVLRTRTETPCSTARSARSAAIRPTRPASRPSW